MREIKGQSILLGGIGGDSHSVGLNIIRQALAMNGYNVLYLGTQNDLKEFFRYAHLANAVLISNMDGHARHYLRKFPDLLQEFRGTEALWYLGGNLTIGDAVGYDRQFVEMGFHRVFVKFVDIETVLDLLKEDLHKAKPVRDPLGLWEKRTNRQFYTSLAHLSDEAVAGPAFNSARREVLTHWRTGPAAANLEENATYLRRQPSFPKEQAKVNAGRKPILIQPRSGVASVNDQIKLFRAFKSIGARVVSYQVDSLTRNNNYSGAQEMIQESRFSGESGLNGFPVVNHGVLSLRQIMAKTKLPIQTRHSTRDPRLLAEISYAGGVTAFEGGAICYNIPYYRDYPLWQSIPCWQYVDRLTGIYYDKFGIALDREFFGTLTATLIPPSLAIIVNLLQSILAAQQGVKCLSVGYAEQGHRIQDIAAIEALRTIIPKILLNLGFRDVQVNTIFHQYMAAFPPTAPLAENLIMNSGTTAQLSRATRILTKTPVEAIKIPTMTDNIHGLSLTMRGVNAAAEVKFDQAAVDREVLMIEHEVMSLFDRVLVAGQGKMVRGIVKAFEEGSIDIPFAPSVYNRGEATTARDAQGAVRFLTFGKLPFDRDTKAFHRELMTERRRLERLKSEKQDYLLIEKDVLRIARGQFESWPLFG